MLRALQLEFKMNAPHQLVILVVSALLSAGLFALFGSMESAVSLALVATSTNLYISQIEADELPGWEAQCSLWPQTRQQVVIARYLELFGAMVVSLLVSMACCLAAQAACGSVPLAPLDAEISYDLGVDLAPGVLVFNAAALCALETALLLPLRFLSFSAKITWVISAVSVFFNVFFIAVINYLASLYVWVFGEAYWVISTGTVAAIALAISTLVAAHVYARRDL